MPGMAFASEGLPVSINTPAGQSWRREITPPTAVGPEFDSKFQ
jgi:hypothetical protein